MYPFFSGILRIFSPIYEIIADEFLVINVKMNREALITANPRNNIESS